MMNFVVSGISSVKARRIRVSVRVSTALVESSRISILGFFSSARAMHTVSYTHLDKVSQSIGKRPHSLKLYGRRRNGRYFQMLCITMIFVSLGNLYPPWRVAFLKSQGDG